jgi:hemerythrin superfamily protein
MSSSTARRQRPLERVDEHGWRVTDRVRGQHETIRRLFDEAAARDTAGRDAFRRLVRLLAVHETAEEVVVHPAAAACGWRGLTAAQTRKAEERVAKIALARLEGTDPHDGSFTTGLAALRADVLAHADAEEREILPLLDRRCPGPTLQAMDRVFVLVQAIGPTHAHRFAPVSAAGNLAVGPVVGAVDRLRDAVLQAR